MASRHLHPEAACLYGWAEEATRMWSLEKAKRAIKRRVDSIVLWLISLGGSAIAGLAAKAIGLDELNIALLAFGAGLTIFILGALLMEPEATPQEPTQQPEQEYDEFSTGIARTEWKEAQSAAVDKEANFIAAKIAARVARQQRERPTPKDGTDGKHGAS